MPGISDMRDMLKKAMELAQPDLRKYYRVPRKGKIVAAYASSGEWFADVQPLKNDESDDPNEPILPKLELPILWGGPMRGVVCPPEPGTRCTIAYWDGDPSYPYIANIRWYGQGAPNCDLKEFIIQQEPGVSIKIDVANKILSITPTNVETKVGQNWIVEAGQNVTVKAGAVATVQAPQINLMGNITATGQDGETGQSEDKSERTHTGSYTLNGPCTINGSLVVTGGITGKVSGCSGC